MNFNEEKSPLSLLIKIISACGGLILGFLICRIFIFSYTVQNESMKPSLRPGDRVFIFKQATPKKGDIVLFKSPVEPKRVLLKRIIAAEGDTVEIRNKIFYINNQKFHFPWKTIQNDSRAFPMTFTYRDNLPAVRIKRNYYFVIGDSLDMSFDSRAFGVIHDNLIRGKMIYRYWTGK